MAGTPWQRQSYQILVTASFLLLIPTQETHQLDISIDTLAAAANSIATHQSAAASPNVIDSGNFSTSKHMGTTEFDECESKKKKNQLQGSIYHVDKRGCAMFSRNSKLYVHR